MNSSGAVMQGQRCTVAHLAASLKNATAWKRRSS